MDKETLEAITIEANNISEILKRIWQMRRIYIFEENELHGMIEKRVNEKLDGVLFYIREIEKQLL